MSIRHFPIILLLFLFIHTGFGATRTDIPWKTPVYSYTARKSNVSDILTTFAAAQGIGISLPPKLPLTISGNFHALAPQDFLEQVCTLCNLVWYYDGACLYICSATDLRSVLMELHFMKASDVIEILRDLNVEDSRFPMVCTKDSALLKISGPPRYVELIQELVQKADVLRKQRLSIDEEIRIFKLKHAWADDVSLGNGALNKSSETSTVRGVANILRDLMSSQGSSYVSKTKSDAKKQDDQAETATEQPEQEISQTVRPPQILADTRLNAVIIRDAKARMPYYEQLIQQLDTPIRMVEIAVTILDIEKSALLDWELRLKALGGKRKIRAGGGLDVDNLDSPDSLQGLGLSGALTYISNSFSLASSIAAMEEKGKARTISRPSLLTLDNVSASLHDTRTFRTKLVGREVVELAEATTGINLTVQPRIVDLPQQPVEAGKPAPPAYEIWMTLQIEDGDFEAVTVDDVPMSRGSTLSTQAGVQEGQCLLIGGYMHEVIEEKAWGIPWLRSIPFIGWLFGGYAKDKSIVQRMFLLTPRMIVFNHLSSDPVEASVKQRNVNVEDNVEDAIRRRDEKHDADEQIREELRKEREEELREEEKQRLKNVRDAIKRRREANLKAREEKQKQLDAQQP